MLHAESRRAGVLFPIAGRAVIDVLQIYQSRERRDLETALTFYCSKRHEQAHRADQDVLATALILDAQLQRYGDLPHDVRELHRQFMEVDLAGRFRTVDGEPVFAFGKHTGRRLQDVANDDPSYLDWILAGNFFDDVKELVRKAIG
jgi:DNA polymerase III subunit epsilon